MASSVRSCAVLLLATSLATPLATSSAVRADVGVIPTIVEGFEGDTADRRKKQLDINVENTLGQSFVRLELKPDCNPGNATSLPDAKCVLQAVGSLVEVDEVAQVVLRRAGPNLTEMKLRIFGRDGVMQQELKDGIVDAEAVDATTAMLRKAFDPAKYSGTAAIRGAPANAELLVDGLRIEEPRAELRVGRHILDVVHEDGSVETTSFDVAFQRTTDVAVPSGLVEASAGPNTAFIVSASTGAVGVAAVIAGVLLVYVASENQKEWGRRAEGATFPRDEDDPRCSGECEKGWLDGYGPLGPGSTPVVGQGARFMMVAFSRDNQLTWDSTFAAALGISIAGTATIVGGGLGTLALWPAEEPTE